MAEIQIVDPQEVVHQPDPKILRDAWAERLASEYTANTRAAYLKGLDLFLEWIAAEGIPLPRVVPADVSRWRDALRGNYSAQTVNLRLSAVRRFYGWLIEQGAPISNPAREVRGASRRGSRRHKRDELTSSEVKSLLATTEGGDLIDVRDRAMLALMSYCALRSVEIMRANVGDFQTRDGQAILWVHGKGHGEADDFVVLARAEIPLRVWIARAHEGSDPDAPLFYSFTRGKGSRLSTRSISRMVKQRMREVGIKNGRKTTHSLRHSAISTALRKGASPLQVQAMARHSSFDTTMNYVHEIGRLEDPAEAYVTYD